MDQYSAPMSTNATPALAQLRDSIQNTQQAVNIVQDVMSPSTEQYNPPIIGPNMEQYTSLQSIDGDTFKTTEALKTGDALPPWAVGLSEDMIRRKLEKREKLKLKRRANKFAKRAQVQAVIGGSASSENLQQGFIVGDQDPAPKRPRISTRVNTYNEGRALPQATGPITHYVIVESSDNCPLDEAARIKFLGHYTKEVALLPRDSPHRGFISSGVTLHENKIKITCLTPEGASSVLALVSRCAGYSATVCLDEKMTRVIVGVPRYMAGPEMGDSELLVKALEALNHCDEDPLPVDGMKYVSIIPSTNDTANGQGQPGQMSVILDVKDGVLEWLRKHRWELKTVSSVARAHLVKNS